MKSVAPTANQAIIHILTTLTETNSVVGKALKREGESFALLSGSKTLFEISPTSAKLLGKHGVSAKLKPSEPSTKRAMIGDAELRAFFEAISDSVVRLNHLGISYSCTSINQEIGELTKLLEGSGLHLYQEPAESKYERWFFIGDRTQWEEPLFEVVMSESRQHYTNEWVPHFQIDLDTNLSIEQLQTMTDKHLGKEFFKWLFDIPDYGVVLGTGRLADIYGTKVYLALGTRLRGTEWHRQHGLQDSP